MVSDPSAVADLLRDQARRTETRSALSQRHPSLEEVSPTVGVLDEAATSAAHAADPDATADLLADLARATDPGLRAAARRLAVRLLVPPPRAGSAARRGTSRLATVPDEGLDLDLDATLERRLAAPSPSSPGPSSPGPSVSVDDLRWRGWRSPGRSVVLLVDASGSVAGAPLTTAVTTAGALCSAPSDSDELGVVAFWSRAVVLRHLRSPSPAVAVLDSLLDLRGGSTTDLALGLRVALDQAASGRHARTEIVVLTDGAWNVGDDPAPVAGSAGPGVSVHTLVTVDSPDAHRTCGRLAAAGGGRSVALLRPSAAPEALASLLG